MSTSLVGVVDDILWSCVDCRFSDDIKMAAQALTFFSAGNDTTSLTISFTLYELALNPTIQARLRQELKETFAKHGDFTYDAIYEMKYLDMVVNGKFTTSNFLSPANYFRNIEKVPIDQFLESEVCEQVHLRRNWIYFGRRCCHFNPSRWIALRPRVLPRSREVRP
jgi:hypothetical protein